MIQYSIYNILSVFSKNLHLKFKKSTIFIIALSEIKKKMLAIFNLFILEWIEIKFS